MASSFRSYRSALSTFWANAGGTGSNPLLDPSISRAVTGYAKLRSEQDAKIRAERRETIPLTVELLADVTPHALGARGGSPRDVMLWAAACMLVFGLNRCNEVFASTRLHRPPLPARAVQFFRSPASVLPRALCPEGAWQREPVPDHYSVALGSTKADPLGANPDQRIAAEPAVRALWRWAHIRRDLGGGLDDPLFAVPGGCALKRTELWTEVARWVALASGSAVAPKVTGKAFRRGGNQSLVAAGASVPELMHAGRWRSSGMPAVYSSAAANGARALHVSRGLGVLFSSAAAAVQR
jgi:hypothetical protein